MIEIAPDTLRRKGADDYADDFEDLVVSDYLLPRIYTGLRDRPDGNAYPNVRDRRPADERTREMAVALRAAIRD